MNFDTPFLKIIRSLLIPFSLLYGLIIRCRNWCYDKRIFESQEFQIPVICVGNLSVGGTGKTPMVEFLVRAFARDYKLAIVSRGYKRKTRGFLIADGVSTATELGDEPMQFHQKFANITVVVGEKRAMAINSLLSQRPETELVLLDDAFQHRAVRAGLNILLTDYQHLYTNDLLLPSGNLRDEKRSARRADIIVVTKCPGHFSEKQRRDVYDQIKPTNNQPVFFTGIQYGTSYHLVKNSPLIHDPLAAVLLVTGIANPARLRAELTARHKEYHELVFPDHHAFTNSDIQNIKHRFAAIAGPKFILTTEKDATRLKAYSQQLEDLPVYVIPIESKFLFDDAERFTEIITTFIQRYNRKQK